MIKISCYKICQRCRSIFPTKEGTIYFLTILSLKKMHMCKVSFFYCSNLSACKNQTGLEKFIQELFTYRIQLFLSVLFGWSFAPAFLSYFIGLETGHSMPTKDSIMAYWHVYCLSGKRLHICCISSAICQFYSN